MIRPASFSYQRKAGMPSLLPCRIPAWLAGVVGRQERLPAAEPVAAGAHPAGQVRDAAGPDLAGQDRLGEPVDLDDDEARLVGAHDVPRWAATCWMRIAK